MLKSFSTIIAVLCLVGCTSLEKINYTTVQKLTSEESALLNGRYANAPSENHTRLNDGRYRSLEKYHTFLWNEITSRDPMLITDDLYTQDVAFKIISAKKCKIELWQGDKMLDSRIFHGKIKDGYFYLRQRSMVIPLPPLVFGYKFTRTRIGVVENGISVDHRLNFWAIALLGGVNTNERTNAIFVKKNPPRN